MIKLVVNTPKGGVGKTTTATNIALLLARQGYRVMAVDLAAGLLMSQTLASCPEFSGESNNTIVQKEGHSIPENFPRASNFDYAVLDTDDTFTVAEDLLLGTRPSWKVISPVNPNDAVGLSRIPREIRAVVLATLLTPSELSLSIVTNMAYGGDSEDGYNRLSQQLSDNSIVSLLSSTVLPHGNVLNQTPLILLDDRNYSESLTELLRSMGVSL
ncbi:AAA family ATPase [Vibrio parahaemolyticus]|uniref:nucleotide-binding protein n=1 Tax=Vibrio parahaemolyticus TaxID=670 RepID=UPI001DAF7D7B|nr:AAA family ATPase [Vibrio parahaemolyticus]EJG1726483.1 AAA family ATPase [Vibrio parahaemolyticus]EJG1740181.1 AAA family ATPase [Vibrio parahaemolyticus]EJG1754344.1 AAA family ATPase [Vibrio parahaemolyticus]EJG1758892.1 AAA family ATPase [Vibrio parahaemolyticus]UYW16418.1 AAA family ATPase [Vibrio parahaemolyticus]